jgi:hypothetical protein
LPDLILKSKSRKVRMSIRYLNRLGACDLTLLKDTMLLNATGTVRPYSKTSLGIFKENSEFRLSIIKLIESK